jgi:hypothetical protein
LRLREIAATARPTPSARARPPPGAEPEVEQPSSSAGFAAPEVLPEVPVVDPEVPSLPPEVPSPPEVPPPPEVPELPASASAAGQTNVAASASRTIWPRISPPVCAVLWMLT